MNIQLKKKKIIYSDFQVLGPTAGTVCLSSPGFCYCRNGCWSIRAACTSSHCTERPCCSSTPTELFISLLAEIVQRQARRHDRLHVGNLERFHLHQNTEPSPYTVEYIHGYGMGLLFSLLLKYSCWGVNLLGFASL